jgi:glycosyltransferase involved in cell wall biosynthesis
MAVRPRLLHVFKDYWPTPGGVERTIQSLVRGCAADYDCTVLVNADSPRTRVERRDGALIIRAGTLGRVAMTPISPAFLCALRRTRADLVHLHAPNPPGELGFLAARPARRMVLSFHNDLIRPTWAVPLYRPWLRRVLRSADRVLVGDRRSIAASPDLPLVGDRCAVVPYGVDPERLELNAEARERASQLRRESRGLLILFVGRFRYYKGLQVLVRAMRSVDGTLLLVGDGPEEASVRRLVDRLGLCERVRFVGHVPDPLLPAYYHAADVLVLPSIYRSESFGLAMVEAHLAGTPTISTELGTATSVVNRHGETGLVVRPASVDQLAGALRAMAEDDARRASWGEHARRRAREIYSSERMVAQTRDLYGQVLAHA